MWLGEEIPHLFYVLDIIINTVDAGFLFVTGTLEDESSFGGVNSLLGHKRHKDAAQASAIG